MSLTTIKYIIKADGIIEEEVQGVNGHACQRITYPIENDAGDIVNRKYLPSFFITDSSPIEENIQRLEDEDWRGCCNTWGCLL
tara:strand:- start:295 stop:543 length:249 start_codon:yes stop_codon:yes gene_type:complete